jgi:hypothetical protein
VCVSRTWTKRYRSYDSLAITLVANRVMDRVGRVVFWTIKSKTRYVASNLLSQNKGSFKVIIFRDKCKIGYQNKGSFKVIIFRDKCKIGYRDSPKLQIITYGIKNNL